MSDSDPQRAVTQKDIATKLGLNQATVSRALKNDSRISPSQRKMIQQTAKSLGYEPNATATALSHFKRSSNAIPIHAALAWINAWPNPEELRSYKEFDAYWHGAQSAANKLGYHLDEFICHEPAQFKHLPNVLKARGITGILLPPHKQLNSAGKEVLWDQFPWQHFSTVRLGRSVIYPPSHLVTSNQVANIITAFNTMQERGYQRIGFVYHESPILFFDAGFLKARLNSGSKERFPVLSKGSLDASSLLTKLKQWLKQEKPDAVLTTAEEIPDMIRQCGYRIPEDIGIAASNILDAQVDAGMRQSPEEIGRVAVLVLNSLIHDNDQGIPQIPRESQIKGTWVDGESLPRRN